MIIKIIIQIYTAINAPTSGARDNKEVSVGSASFQLYSLSTPNGKRNVTWTANHITEYLKVLRTWHSNVGQKPAILLEELGIDYDAHGNLIFTLYDMVDSK